MRIMDNWFRRIGRRKILAAGGMSVVVLALGARNGQALSNGGSVGFGDPVEVSGGVLDLFTVITASSPGK
ncbi:hypothetical protein BH23ACT11_BH23ACT11_29100 [soil metagenome]